MKRCWSRETRWNIMGVHWSTPPGQSAGAKPITSNNNGDHPTLSRSSKSIFSSRHKKWILERPTWQSIHIRNTNQTIQMDLHSIWVARNSVVVLFKKGNIKTELLDEAELPERLQDCFVKITGQRQNCQCYIGAQSIRRGLLSYQRDSGIEDLRG